MMRDGAVRSQSATGARWRVVRRADLGSTLLALAEHDFCSHFKI